MGLDAACSVYVMLCEVDWFILFYLRVKSNVAEHVCPWHAVLFYALEGENRRVPSAGQRESGTRVKLEMSVDVA